MLNCCKNNILKVTEKPLISGPFTLDYIFTSLEVPYISKAISNFSESYPKKENIATIVWEGQNYWVKDIDQAKVIAEILPTTIDITISLVKDDESIVYYKKTIYGGLSKSIITLNKINNLSLNDNMVKLIIDTDSEAIIRFYSLNLRF